MPFAGSHGGAERALESSIAPAMGPVWHGAGKALLVPHALCHLPAAVKALQEKGSIGDTKYGQKCSCERPLEANSFEKAAAEHPHSGYFKISGIPHGKQEMLFRNNQPFILK